MTSARSRRQESRSQGRRQVRALFALVKTPITTTAVLAESPREAKVAAACKVFSAFDRSRRSGTKRMVLRTSASASSAMILSAVSEAARSSEFADVPSPHARNARTSTGRAWTITHHVANGLSFTSVESATCQSCEYQQTRTERIRATITRAADGVACVHTADHVPGTNRFIACADGRATRLQRQRVRHAAIIRN